MSIKGLREALAKKQVQQQSEVRTADSAAVTAGPTIRPVGKKPPKKATGRGR